MQKINGKVISAAIRKWTARWFDEDNQRFAWCLFYVCYCGLIVLLGFSLFLLFVDFMEDYCQ